METNYHIWRGRLKLALSLVPLIFVSLIFSPPFGIFVVDGIRRLTDSELKMEVTTLCPPWKISYWDSPGGVLVSVWTTGSASSLNWEGLFITAKHRIPPICWLQYNAYFQPSFRRKRNWDFAGTIRQLCTHQMPYWQINNKDWGRMPASRRLSNSVAELRCK